MKKFNLQNPFYSKIKKRYLISKDNQIKKTYHFVLDISNANIFYKPGDSLAIIPQNDNQIVEKILKKLQIDRQKVVFDKRKKQNLSIFDFLLKRANICKISSALFKIALESQKDIFKKEKFQELFKNKKLLKKYLQKYHLIDFLEEHDVENLNVQDLCDNLFRIIPRFYSIASSKKHTPDEIHLTVVVVTYTTNDISRKGVCTNFICNTALINETKLPIYVQESSNFNLLESHFDKDIIMIGPGTGVAPFRAFLEERYFSSHTGRNWLFFGECNKRSHFYYREFFQKLEKKEFLKLTTAFSRDQKEKIYVQHKMLEHSKEIFSWLEKGAFLFVCGDANKMAKDIDQALIQIISKEKKVSTESAFNILMDMIKKGRYCKDVY
jgi:sulfite reductase (NADPH) flavoprotein alpha-component